MKDAPPRGMKAGDRYRQLVAIEDTGERDRRNNAYWLFQCDCGLTVKKLAYQVKGGNHTCGKRCALLKHHEKTAKRQWLKSYSDGLPFERFLELSQLNCHYCNAPPGNRATCGNKGRVRPVNQDLYVWTYNGLDRIDSTKDHSEGNVVPCCKHCNSAKMAQPYDQFIEQVRRIWRHRAKPCPEKGKTDIRQFIKNIW